jgi:hypothetical protein
MINLDHDHFQHKTVIYFVQTFGNIYTIVPFCKHALRVFHEIAWLIFLAHAQTNFPPVVRKSIFVERLESIDSENMSSFEIMRIRFHLSPI